MEITILLMIASGLSGAAFFLLLVGGLVSRARRGEWQRRRGFAAAWARAGQRFARGEIDAAAFRSLRDDLRAGL